MSSSRTSEVLLNELLEVLQRPKFASRLGQAGLTAQGIVDDLRQIAFIVTPAQTPRVMPSAPDDDHVIAAGVAGDADLIASGDRRDLLPLGSCQGIAVVSAREAVVRLEARLSA